MLQAALFGIRKSCGSGASLLQSQSTATGLLFTTSRQRGGKPARASVGSACRGCEPSCLMIESRRNARVKLRLKVENGNTFSYSPPRPGDPFFFPVFRSGQPLKIMMLDRYGNYVVQRMMDVAPSDLRPALLSLLRQQVDVLKKFTYGRCHGSVGTARSPLVLRGCPCSFFMHLCPHTVAALSSWGRCRIRVNEVGSQVLCVLYSTGKHIVTALDRIDSNASSPATDAATAPSVASGAAEPFTPTGRGHPGGTVPSAGCAPGKCSGLAPSPSISRSSAVSATTGPGVAQPHQQAVGQRHHHHRGQPQQQQQAFSGHLGSDSAPQSMSPSAMSPAASGSVRSRCGNAGSEFGGGTAAGWRRGGGQHFLCRNVLTGSPRTASGVLKGGRATTEGRPTGFERPAGGGGGASADFTPEDRRLPGAGGRTDATQEWLNPTRLQQLFQIDNLSPSARASTLAALHQCLGSFSGFSPSPKPSGGDSSRFPPVPGGGAGDADSPGVHLKHRSLSFADSQLLRRLSQLPTPSGTPVAKSVGAAHGVGGGAIGAADNQESAPFVRAHTPGRGTGGSGSLAAAGSPVQLLPYLSFPGASQPVRGGGVMDTDASGQQPLPTAQSRQQHAAFSQLHYSSLESRLGSFRSLSRAASSGFLYGGGGAPASSSASAPGAAGRRGSGEHCATHQREGSSSSGRLALTPEMVNEVLNAVQQYQRQPVPSAWRSRESDGPDATPPPPQNPTNPRRPP